MALASSKARRFVTGLKGLCVGRELRKEDTNADFVTSPANITRLDSALFTVASPGAIAAGTTVEVTVTVSDANLGDMILITPPATIEAGLTVGNAYVSAANTIKFRISNVSAGTVTPALQTLTYTYFLIRTQA